MDQAPPAAAPAPVGRSRPSAADRALDLLALALLVGGMALFFYARAHLQELADGEIVRVPGHSAVEQSVRYDRLSRFGLWTAGGGLVLAVLSSLLRRRRPPSPTAGLP